MEWGTQTNMNEGGCSVFTLPVHVQCMYNVCTTYVTLQQTVHTQFPSHVTRQNSLSLVRAAPLSLIL